jgi:acyl-CoA thioesterase
MTVVDETAAAIRTRLEDIHAGDPALRYLDIELVDGGPGTVTLSMPVTVEMANAHGICHGGYLFTLADSALAYCCATVGGQVVTRTAEITYIAPAVVGQTVTATATRRVSFGRNQIIEVVLEVDATTIAYFSGQGTVPPRTTERTGL